jgi:hypothetical protein
MPSSSRQETERVDPRVTRSTSSSSSNQTRASPYLRKTRSYIVSRPAKPVTTDGITFLENMERLEGDGVGITVNHNGVSTRFAFDFKGKMIVGDGVWKYFDAKEMQQGDGETKDAKVGKAETGQAEDVEAGQAEEEYEEGEEELEEAEEVLDGVEAELEEAEQQYEGLRPKTQIDVQIDVPSWGKIKLDDYMSKTDAQYAHITEKVNEILDMTRKTLVDQRRATREALKATTETLNGK